jgi:hypothetical protein
MLLLRVEMMKMKTLLRIKIKILITKKITKIIKTIKKTQKIIVNYKFSRRKKKWCLILQVFYFNTFI